MSRDVLRRWLSPLQDSFLRLSYIFLGFFLLITLLGASFIALQEYQNILASQLQRVRGNSLFFEVQLTQTLQHVENILRAWPDMSSKLGPAARPESLDSLLRSMQYNQPAIRSISVLDAQGRVLRSSESLNLDQRLKPQSFMPGEAGSGSIAVMQFGPLLGGRDVYAHEDGRTQPGKRQPHFIPLQLRVGESGATQRLLVTLNPDYLLNLFVRYSDSVADSVEVLRQDGQLLLTNRDMATGRSHAGHGSWRLSEHDSGHVDLPGELVSFRASSRYPFDVVVHVHKDQIWQQWLNKSLPMMGWIALVMAITLAVFCFLVHRVHTVRQEKAKEQRASFRLGQALAQSPNGLMITDLQGRVEYCNRAFSQCQGLCRARAADAQAGLRQQCLKGVATPQVLGRLGAGEGWSSERMLPAADQAVRHLQVLWAPLRDQHGQVTHGICVEHDITPIKQMQQDLAASRDQAEQAARAKSHFLANMSHEIRTPMSGIIGMTQLALDETLPERAQEFVSMANTSAVSLLGILNDILDFSKIEAGMLQLEHARFHLHELLHRTLRPYALMAQDKGLAFDLAIAGDTPHWVVSDPLRLSQVLNNIVNNAIKFTQTGQVSVKAWTSGAQDHRICLNLVVADTGRGMSTQEQAQLFQPFTQANTSTARLFGGTGLGLTISNRLVQAFRGQLRVSSVAGEGSSFALQIPMELSHTADARAGHLPDIAPVRSGLRGKRVLLVEDHPINRQMMTVLLTKIGVEVVGAFNGCEAVALLNKSSRTHFDAVLMDIQMPEMDGIEATEHIRRLYPSALLPIIAVTANALRDEKDRCLAVGMQDYLVKPIDRNALYDCLMHWIRTG